MGRKLYVGNLPYEISETELQDLFAQAGSVESVNVMRDQATGRARGFAFVEMSSDDEAQKAITALDGSQVGGRNLTVNEARPKTDRGGGGGGYRWWPGTPARTALVEIRERSGRRQNGGACSRTIDADIPEGCRNPRPAFVTCSDRLASSSKYPI